MYYKKLFNRLLIFVLMISFLNATSLNRLYAIDSAANNAEANDEETVEQDDGSELKNPQLMQRFDSAINSKYSFGEHLIINIMTGTLTGAIFGGISGLSLYNSSDTDTSYEKMGLFAGGLGLTGAVAGTIFTLVEFKRTEQFTLSKRVIYYTWYGGLAGALGGGLAGLIPYSSSKDKDDIYKFVGFGTAAGLLVSWLLLGFYRPGDSTNSIKISTFFDPKSQNYGLNIVNRF